tara:strand:+ start:301 stop:579 length:279 start_codon:yes stop_codon:yes gene_type:complete
MKLKKEDLKRIIREEVDSHLNEPELEPQGPREGSVQGLDVEGKKGMFDQPDFKSKVAWVKRNKPEVDDPDAYVAGALRKAGKLKEDKKHSVQ